MSSRATIDRFLRDVASGEYFAGLVNRPTPHHLRVAPQVIHHATLHDQEPRLTIVTPTFDCAAFIADYVNATAASASLPFDWIIIDDGSSDGTVERAQALLEGLRCPLVCRATVLRNPAPIFETACDNIGFTLAETEAIIEVQCDIQVREPGYDALLLNTLGSAARPASVSGRCGHTFMHLRRSTVGRWFEPAKYFVGLCGRTIDTPEKIDGIRGKVYRCETVNRGPWALLKTDLRRFGYLDERFFFLGNDDHDYHRRLLEAEGRTPLYVAISVHSPQRLGASRRARQGTNRTVFEMLAREKSGSPEFLAFLTSLNRCSPPQEITVAPAIR